MPNCPRCNKRAAKRFCPALSTKICAVCCAQDRMIELACPESCHYLNDAREQTAPRENEMRLKEFQAEGKMPPKMSELALEIVSLIFGSIVAAQRDKEGVAIFDLKDDEILEAINVMFKNLRTEESGLIYEHTSRSPRIDKVSQSIRNIVDKLIGQDTPEGRVTRSETMRALEFVRSEVEAHLKRNDNKLSSRGFLRYIALYVPWPEAETGPRIISL